METINYIYKSYHQLFRIISKTKLFGWLPLDILLHFGMGIILMTLFIKLTKSYKYAFLFVFIIQLVKEFFDSFSLTATWSEAFLDTAITLIYPLLVLIISKLKEST